MNGISVAVTLRYMYLCLHRMNRALPAMCSFPGLHPEPQQPCEWEDGTLVQFRVFSQRVSHTFNEAGAHLLAAYCFACSALSPCSTVFTVSFTFWYIPGSCNADNSTCCEYPDSGPPVGMRVEPSTQ